MEASEVGGINASITYSDDNFTDGYPYFDILEPGDLELREFCHKLNLYVAPVLILGGTIGNILCLIILQNKVFRRIACGFLLSALAVADIGVLNMGLLRLWIIDLTKYRLPTYLDVRSLSDAGCKIHAGLTYFFPQLSSWTLVLVTIDRVISVAKPLRSHEISSRGRMNVAWLVVTVVLFAINIIPMVHYYRQSHPLPTGLVIYACIPDDDSFKDIYAWVDFVFAFLIPLILIACGNVFIIYMLVKAGQNRRISLSAQTAHSTRGERTEVSHSATAMLVAVSIMFFITTIPRSIYFVGLPWSSLSHTKLDFFYKVCILVYNFSNAINFLLYCISGSKFRKALLQPCCASPKGPRNQTMNSRSTSRESNVYLTSLDNSTVLSTKITRPSDMSTLNACLQNKS